MQIAPLVENNMFNTLVFSKKMQNVGMTQEVAEELASTLFNIHLNQFESLLTKAEFSRFDSEIKNEIENFVTKAEFSRFEKEIKNEIDKVKIEINDIKHEMENFVTKVEFSRFEKEIKNEINHIKHEIYAEMKNLNLNITIKMGIIMTAGISVLGLIIKL